MRSIISACHIAVVTLEGIIITALLRLLLSVAPDADLIHRLHGMWSHSAAVRSNFSTCHVDVVTLEPKTMTALAKLSLCSSVLPLLLTLPIASTVSPGRS